MDRRRPVIALLDTHVAMCLVVVACLELEFYPSGRDQLAIWTRPLKEDGKLTNIVWPAGTYCDFRG